MDSSQGSEIDYQPNSDGIPIDLFVSKKKAHNKDFIGFNGFSLKFTDSSANILFTVDRPLQSRFHQHHSHSSEAPPPFLKRLLCDSSGTALISIAHDHKATWEGFRKESSEMKDLMFRVESTKNTLTRIEFEVFINNGDVDSPKKSDFKMRGSPFYRSCTIYNGKSIVAQTSLMYKLGIKKVLVPRNRFRLTIFPGFADHAFIVALTVIFFYGRKLWI